MNDFFFPILQVTGASLGALVLLQIVLPALAKRKKISRETLQTIIAVAEKVVMSLEQTGGELSGADKKMKARALVREILSRMKIAAPDALLDTAIEAAVLLMNALTKRRQPS